MLEGIPEKIMDQVIAMTPVGRLGSPMEIAAGVKDQRMANTLRRRVAIACQGGGSHTAFTAGVLQGLLGQLPEEVDVVALSGTSGGAICASLAWDGLLRR